MTHTKWLFLFSFIFLQTACTQNPVIKKTPQPQVHHSKTPPIETTPYKNEVITVEEIPSPKPVISIAPAVPVLEHASAHSVSLPTAVQSLMADAEKNTKAGDLDSASVMLERALRISPRNATVTYQLAALRLKQSQPRLAEDLGKKAAFLAAEDHSLKKRCWLLIAQAREAQGNLKGAKEAQLKADSLE